MGPCGSGRTLAFYSLYALNTRIHGQLQVHKASQSQLSSIFNSQFTTRPTWMCFWVLFVCFEMMFNAILLQIYKFNYSNNPSASGMECSLTDVHRQNAPNRNPQSTSFTRQNTITPPYTTPPIQLVPTILSLTTKWQTKITFYAHNSGYIRLKPPSADANTEHTNVRHSRNDVIYNLVTMCGRKCGDKKT